MIQHLAAMLVSAIAFLGAILLYGAFSPRRLGGWKFWICFAAYCVLMEGAGPLANGLYSVCGVIGNNVGQQILYNTTIYCLLYAILYKEKPMVYLSITVIFYSWICCIENLVVGAMLMLQADTVRSALENPTRSWLFWIDQLLVLCGCAAIRKAHPFQPQTNGSQNRFAIPAIISLVSMAMTARLQNGYYQDEINGAFLFYFSAVLLFADVMTFVLIVWNEKDERLKGENLTLTARARTQAESIEALLAERASLVQPSRKRQRNSLHIAENILDMDHIPELSRYDRCRICVPQSCPRDCFMRLDCRYQQYLRDSMKPDIQICNHNYLLADASHRQEDRPLLLRSYQALVVDEAHKLPDAARQMYTETLSQHNMDELCLILQQAHYKDFARQMRTAFLTLSFSCTQGLSKLRGKASEPFVLTPFRRAALIDCIALLQNAGGLPDVPRYLLNRLGEAESLLRLFLLEVPTRILYIDYDADGQPTFCAASSRVPQLLRSALWNTREPAILTSGTLAAAGDFSHTEQLLGLAAYAPLRHFRADSPFNYKKKCLLYFPPRVKMQMDNRKMAEEIVRLVDACHGHALVLFTSYRQMAEVKAMTDGRWPYPTFQAWRNGGRVIQQFKESGNGVLFAAGSCWEGIDFPGNMVSLLIIPKLPFPIPDPVSDYERQKYPNLQEYIASEIIPEMQKKLRQGFGRAIRTEQDSCVVAILDERAGIGGKYHDAALAALPTCPITEKIEDVQQFIREQKRPDYFL